MALYLLTACFVASVASIFLMAVVFLAIEKITGRRL